VEWGFIWLMFVLKIPLIALLWIVWHAIKAVPEDAEAPLDGGNGDRDHPRTPRHRPPPRRGPHAEPVPPAPARMRVLRGRTFDATHR
jgi:hypothetical protein